MHTPGPWEVRWGCNVFAKRADTGSEGVVAACGGHSSNKVACRPENEANARLVATAPDLLAALVRLVACPDVNLDMLSPETIVAADQARDAIRKARGQ
jgi:hypothetical protein